MRSKNPTMHFLQGKDQALEEEVTHVAAILETRKESRDCKSSSYYKGHRATK